MVIKVLEHMGESKPTDAERALERQTPGAGKAQHKARVSKRLKYWFGRTRHLSPGDIHGIIRKAKDGKNPGALFNYLLKQTKNEKEPIRV